MRANQARLSKDSSLSAFFKRVNASPTKKDPPKETTGTETKTPKRKPVKAKEDGEGYAPYSVARARTVAFLHLFKS